jgi:hypothetical protein
VKPFLILLLPVALAGCAVPIGQLQLPMTLGPSDTKATCLTYDGAPAYGDCQKAGSVSIPPAAN